MKKSNLIVRTITINGNVNKPNETHYEINFMTFKKFLHKSSNRFYSSKDYEIKLYPYKWFDLRWLYEKPAYWLLLRIFRNSEAKISRQIHSRTSTITLITEILLVAKPTFEIIKFFIIK